MPAPQDPLNSYRTRRQARLSRLPWLRPATAGYPPAWYRADELLITLEGRDHVMRFLHGNPAFPDPQGDEEVTPGVYRLHVPGIDVLAAVRGIHRALPQGVRVASPHHVFQASPFNHGGPYGPPAPAAPTALAAPAATGGSSPVAVSIIDTGLWSRTPLPSTFLRANGVEYEEATDVDRDGVLDGDVGHANFIGGVYAAHAVESRLSVVKVLDTFGVCTEADVVAALARIDPGTQIINLSLGGYTIDNQPPLAVAQALRTALSGQDRVAVAAAGNDGNSTDPFWPAAFAGAGASWSDQMVAVAAHDGQQLCDWSNTGSWVTLAAPGAGIRSTFIDDPVFPQGWATWSGTSFATPHAGAAIAKLVTGAGPVAALAGLKAAPHARIGGCPALT
ncbi:S8 family serine peptidase [Actinoplanes sp. NPDC051411]|uniref:S8 family serine peptidase n=1 Tax=Actinoplanes sp. NPDC051411 TaxID=3155522 RepID=UPI003420C01A